MATIGLGMRIEDEAEFQRRVAIALNGCTLSGFGKRLHAKLKDKLPLDAQEQRWLYRLVHERRDEITDEGVREYAAARTRGHDQ